LSAPQIPEVAASLRRLLARCLTKDPRKRLRDIGDARWDLEEARGEQRASRAPVAAGSGRRWLVPALAGAAGLALGAFLDLLGSVSPDGRWLVYQSNEAGDYAVYVAPFPSVEWSRRVSAGRGDDPRWSPAGGELFYRDYDRIYRVTYTATDTDFLSEAAELVLELVFHNSWGLSFDVSRDGKRFLVQRPSASPAAERPPVVIEGWQAEVERLAPPA
jgi:hypothetical protein